ncbi:MAG: exodeoxyribonuclease V subunit gamma [Calditrichaceae bacterium]|nr:exodeoxyribonuclease V subunit gamma [Calditrichaceae bacterium]RQV97312.1 MAG: hypothetical protein EH224_01845 [Calditrichota bacterium]
MEKLFIYSGPAGKYYYFQDKIVEMVRNGENGYLYILPVNRAVRYFKKKLIDAAPNQVLIDPPVFTFDGFLLKCFSELNPGRQVIGSDLTQLIIEEILDKHKTHYEYFKYKDKSVTGAVKKISDVLSELRRYGYDSQKWGKIDHNTLRIPEEKYKDFHSLFEQFEERLSTTFIDEFFAMYLAAQQLNEKQFRRIWPDANTIYINGYDLYTPAMTEAIRKLSHWRRVEVKIESSEENQDLFMQTREIFRSLGSISPEIIKTPSSPLSKQLFNRNSAYDLLTEPKNKYQILAGKNREYEVIVIAAKIRELYHEKKIRPAKIAVTFSNLDCYAPMIRKVFKDFNIPFNLSTGNPLNQSPLIQKYIKILSVVNEGFKTQSVFEMMFSLMRFSEEENGLMALYRFIIDQRIRYLNSGWAEIVRRKINDSDVLTDGDKQKLTACLTKYHKKLNILYDFNQDMTIESFRKQYLKALKEFDLLNWYKMEASCLTERQREAEFRAFNRFIKLFEKLLWLLSQIYGQQPVTFLKIYRLMLTMINHASYSLTEKNNYGVQILPRLEVMATDHDILFVGGLIEGEFPHISSKDIFFNDELRAKLGLAAAEEFLNRDRLSFYTLMESPAKQIFLTYPLYEEDRLLIPSTFISDLNDILSDKIEQAETDEVYYLNKDNMLVCLGASIYNNDADNFERDIKNLISTGYDIERILSGLQRIKIQRERRLFQLPGFFEGNLSSNPEIVKLLTDKYQNYSWSSTSLEDYAFCPMVFFLKQILGLEELPEQDEEISPLDRGLAVHKIFYRFYSFLNQKDQCHQPALFLTDLLQIAEEVLNKLPWEGFLGELEKINLTGSDLQPGLLQTYLEYEQEQINATGFVPSHFELSFGRRRRDESDPDSVEQPVLITGANDAIKLSGSIDRIDVHSDGRVLILDYKTGETSTKINAVHFYRGTNFQLPLYAKVLSVLKPGLTPVFLGYYLVKSSQKCERVPALADGRLFNEIKTKVSVTLPANPYLNTENQPLSFIEFLDRVVDLAVHQISRLKKGFFGHTLYPEDLYCQSYCDYRRICRKNIAKLKYLSMQSAQENR